MQQTLQGVIARALRLINRTMDVNETLSDMGPMADRFAAVGAPPGLAATWFTSVLRDGFALTATGQNPSFAGLRTCWINRSKPRYPGYFDAPDIEATSVVDFAEQLRRAG